MLSVLQNRPWTVRASHAPPQRRASGVRSNADTPPAEMIGQAAPF
ncbi:hypothetical protein AB0C06_30265 [Micromonospora inaquosa]